MIEAAATIAVCLMILASLAIFVIDTSAAIRRRDRGHE